MTATLLQQTYATTKAHATAIAQIQPVKLHATTIQAAMTATRLQQTYATMMLHVKAAAQTLNKKQKLNCPALNREKQKANDLETKQ
jgi:hypothetical protein